MKQINLGTGTLTASRLAYGTMNLATLTQKEADEALDAAVESGFTLLDMADIYGEGRSEERVGDYLLRHPDARDQVLLQSKCGIRFAEESNPKQYDLRGNWIRDSVERSLRRLNVDVLDLYLLHRPDPLMHPEEIGKTFDILHREGKVRAFGVSNFPFPLIEEIQKWSSQPVTVNQVELNLFRSDLITEPLFFNRKDSPPGGAAGLESTLERCRKNNITLQAWSALAGGYLSGRPLPEDHDQRELWEKLAEAVKRIALQRGTSAEVVLLSWLLRLPLSLQPLIGTTSPDRIRQCAQADGYTMSRQEWFTLLEARLGRPLP